MSKVTALVVSAYEADLQPLAAASLAASLQHVGFEVAAWDAHIFPQDRPEQDYDLVMICVPLFEGLERGIMLAESFQHTGAKVLVSGQYAKLFPGDFLRLADGVIMEEPEQLVFDIARAFAGEVELTDIPGIRSATKYIGRPKSRDIQWFRPLRELLPPITAYSGHESKFGLLGNIEATRGCHHRCAYCSVYAATGVRVTVLDQDVVVNDACQVSDQGANHLAFVDAEFFSVRKHGPESLKRIANEVGPVTFEFTTRFDHILEFTSEIEELTQYGLRSITSALEFPSDTVLTALDKGIDTALTKRAIKVAQDLGVELAPTFIPFTPWVTYDELLRFDDFIEETGLGYAITPTARQTRLYLYKGSPLLSSPYMQGVELIDQGYLYDWKHDDPRVDELWAELREQAEAAGTSRCCVRC
jgi:radical SAM superfamily enzyme YgiQ (UPF0313 family)